MKHLFNFLIIYFFSAPCLAQLNCSTNKEKDLSVTKTCKHKNGKVSTLEKWDANLYWGSFEAFTDSGQSIIRYQLRKVAGHASVQVKYHANGQISKLEYSSAPDGGIQFYNYIHHYNEKGIQTEYYNLSQPDGHPVLFVPEELTKNKPIQPTTGTNPKTCAAIALTKYTVQNHTRKQVRLILSPNYQLNYPKRNARVLLVDAMTELKVDSILLSDTFLDKETLFTLSLDSTQKNVSKRILITNSEKTPNNLTHTWHLVDKIKLK